MRAPNAANQSAARGRRADGGRAHTIKPVSPKTTQCNIQRFFDLCQHLCCSTHGAAPETRSRHLPQHPSRTNQSRNIYLWHISRDRNLDCRCSRLTQHTLRFSVFIDCSDCSSHHRVVPGVSWRATGTYSALRRLASWKSATVTVRESAIVSSAITPPELKFFWF